MTSLKVDLIGKKGLFQKIDLFCKTRLLQNDLFLIFQTKSTIEYAMNKEKE